MLRRFVGGVVAGVCLTAALLSAAGVLVQAQAPPPLSGTQIGQPAGFINPGSLDIFNHNRVTPAHGRVRILQYQNGVYVPTGQVVAVDNPWPGFSFLIQPVIVEQIGGRWTIISTTP